jgi:hypothetical protein
MITLFYVYGGLYISDTSNTTTKNDYSNRLYKYSSR